jgi:glucan 1,3-beta-glucosidase
MLRLVSLSCLLSILLPLVSAAAAAPRALPFGDASGDAFASRAEMSNSSSLHTLQKRFDFGSTKVRGVNIGGWLVAEPFITPSLFE